MLATVATQEMPSDFDYLYNIDPTIILQPRYAISKNFVGEVVEGYLRQTVVISKKAGQALANVQSYLKVLGFSLVVYDAYRPQKGVNHFVRWS
jgi:D-alanyl-D-alanine dipeptidase